MPYTVVFDEMPNKNPFKIESEFGKPISISTGDANQILDMIEEAIENGEGLNEVENILLKRYEQ